MISPYNKLRPSAFDGPARLSFSTTNAKLVNTFTAAFSLPAGYTCPGACDCLAWFDRKENRLIDGPNSKHRCFAASLEAAFPSVRNSVDRNLAILQQAKTAEKMADIIDMSLPAIFFRNIRIHADGDFFDQSYFLAWLETARRNPKRLFYAYTKSLPFWVKFKKAIPENFVLTASRGGKWDSMIEPNGLRSATVVLHPNEAAKLGLEIDHDDSCARSSDGKDFALLIHGQQPKNSVAGEAIKRLKGENIKFSYNRK